MSYEADTKAVHEAAALVQQYAAGDAVRAMRDLLDALLTVYHDNLERVPPEGLQRLQGAVAQVRALRNALVPGGDTLPRV